MKNYSSILLYFLFALGLFQSCGNKSDKNLYLLEEVTEFNQYIRQTDSIQYDPYKIALSYFNSKYPNPVQQNITVNMEWKDDWLHVDLIETKRKNSDKESVKITLIFNRPMGIYQVHEIRHSWKCRNKVLYSSENCKDA